MADTQTKEKDEILTRLRRVEGQIRGIQRMVEEERECEAIATQLMAARAALDKASLYVMSHHIARCLTATEGHPEKAQLDRVIAFFMRFVSSPSFISPDETGETQAAHDLIDTPLQEK